MSTDPTPRPARTAPEPTVDSPCIGVCQIDERAGHCAGCARTIDEITSWGRSDTATKLLVLEAARERRERRTQDYRPRTSPGAGGGME